MSVDVSGSMLAKDFKPNRMEALKDVAENRAVGDSTTLADPNVMKLISEGLQSGKSED